MVTDAVRESVYERRVTVDGGGKDGSTRSNRKSRTQFSLKGSLRKGLAETGVHPVQEVIIVESWYWGWE